ncbi:hypothetical protein D3C71_1185170 [compost metagenome]
MDPANAKTFADAKGIVIYASASPEQQAAAIEFIKWVYSDDKNDVAFFQETNLPPARDDVGTNEVFKPVFEKTPVLQEYAKAIPNAVPSMDNPKFNELQTFIGQEAFNKIVRGEIDPKTGWDNMKKAIEGELQ